MIIPQAPRHSDEFREGHSEVCKKSCLFLLKQQDWSVKLTEWES